MMNLKFKANRKNVCRKLNMFRQMLEVNYSYRMV